MSNTRFTQPTLRPNLVHGRFYSPETLAGKLETAMLERKVQVIGKPRPHQDRTHGLDLEPTARAYRTLDVKKVTERGLALIHKAELKVGYFVIGPVQMRRITGEEIQDQAFLKPDQLKAVIEYQFRNKPVLDRRWEGHLIPPYFMHDLEFDGMEYHHAWDKCLWHGPSFMVPLEVERRKVSRLVQGDRRSVDD